MKPDLPLVGPLERTLYLRSLPMFDGLRSTELATIAQLMREEYIPRGTILYQQGEPPDKLHLLVDGTVRNEIDEQVIYLQEAPAAAGMNGILGGARASLCGIADTDLTVLEIDAGAFLDVVEDHFDIFLHFRRLYAERVMVLQRELGTFHVPLTSQTADLPCPKRPLDLVERLLCLRRTGVFAEMPINALAQLIRGEKELRLAAGETLWRGGDAGDYLAVVTCGEVLCAPDDPRAAFRAGPGYVLGADAAFGGIPYAYDALVVSPIVAIRIDTAILTDIIEDHFEVGLRFLAHFAREETRLLERKSRAAGV